MHRHLRRLSPGVLLAALMGITPLSNAQDALRGKALYLNTNGAPISCADANCHGTDPRQNKNNVLKGANNAPVIQTAIATKVPEMAFLSVYVSSQNVLDIAAYLGNPTVAAAPVIAVAPSSVAFASTYAGSTSAIAAVTVSNTGSANLSVSSVGVVGTSAMEFRFEGTSTCSAGLTLVPGAACRADLTFRPATTGAKSASLTIGHNAAGGTTSIPLTGTATPPPTPSITVSPAAITFPSTTAGTSSAVYSVVAANTGTATLSFSAISKSGANANDFRIEPSSTCSVSTGVAPGASCRVDLTFNPTVIGSESAALVLAHNAAGGSSSVPLSGIGTVAATPTIALSASALSFGSQEVGTQSATQVVTLTNVGNAVLNISALTAGGSQSADFPRSGSCLAGMSLPAGGGSCTLIFSFAPTAVGSRSGSLLITSNNAAGNVTLSLAGTATTNIPSAAVSPAALTFGSQQVGTTSAAQIVTVRNSGGGLLTISSVVISGSHFTQSGTCAAASLAANQSCTVSIAFAPTASGALTASLTVAHGAAGSPLTVALSGNGTTAPVPVVLAAPALVTFPGVTTVGQPSAPQRVTVTNAGPGSVTLGTITTSSAEFALAGGAAGSCSAALTIAQAASCTLDIRFSPAAPGARSGTLSIASDGTPATLSVALAGDASGVAAAAISADRTTLAFGTVSVASRSQAQPLWLTNTGSTNLDVTAVSVNGPFALATGGTCASPSFTVAPGQACLLLVEFAPMASGAASGTLSIVSNAGTLSVALAGDGFAAPNAGRDVGAGGSPSNTGGGGTLGPDVLALLLALAALARHRVARPPLRGFRGWRSSVPMQ